MRKQIANIITVCRILGSIQLLFCPVFSACFYGVYLFCGFTDMVDGTVARKTNTASRFGAKLDTAADLIFVSVALVKVLPVIHLQKWLWIWVSIIAVIKIGNIVWSIVAQKRLPALHTIANKITGLFLFLLPLTLYFVGTQYSIPIVCAMATFSAIQEGYYIGTGQEILSF